MKMIKYMYISDAAKVLNISKHTLRNWDVMGKFKASKRHPLNNYRMYRLEDIIKLHKNMNK